MVVRSFHNYREVRKMTISCLSTLFCTAECRQGVERGVKKLSKSDGPLPKDMHPLTKR